MNNVPTIKINVFTAVGILYLVIWVVTGIFSIGDIPDCTGEVFNWLDALSIFVAFLLPFLVGYFGGYADASNK